MEDLLEGMDFGELREVNSLTSNFQLEAEESTDENNTSDVSDENIDDNNLETLFKQETDEEEVEKPKVTNKPNTEAPPPKKPSKTSSNVPFALVFKSLQEEEALSDFNEQEFQDVLEKEGPAVAIQSVFKKELELNRNELLAQQEEDFKEYVALKDAGVDTQTAQQLILNKKQFDTLKEEDLSGDDKVEVRKQVLTQKYKLTTSLSEKEITKLVNRTIASGDDEEDAIEALATIKEVNKKNIQLERAKAEQAEIAKQNEVKERINKYKAAVEALDEPIPGTKINKQTKEKVEKAIMSGEMWKLREKDPYGFDAKLAFLVLNGAFEGKLTLPQNKAKSAALQELQKQLSTGAKPTDYKSNTEYTESYEGDDILERYVRNKKKSNY